MIIGLNLLYLLPGVVGGTETYAAGLLEGFAALDDDTRFVVFLNRESAGWPLPAGPRFARLVCPVHARSRLARYRFEQLRLPGLVRGHGVDLLHSLGYVAPLRLACPSVVTVHDLHFRSYGHWRQWPRRLLLDRMVGAAIRRSAAVITVSRFMREAIAHAYGLSPERLDVVLEAARPGHRLAEAAPSPFRGDGPYFLAFGGVTPNKNLPRLLEAWTRARREHGLARRLLIVGRLPPSLPVPEGVVTTGWLEDDVLAAALAGADALVFPSLYEGFGLPVLEAMSAGVPVLCSDRTAIPEVAGDAALYFDPENVGAIASAIARADADPALRARLAAAGRARAAEFSWKRAAGETLAIYRRVLRAAPQA